MCRIPQVDGSINFEVVKTLKKEDINKRWIESHPQYDSEDVIHELNRREQILIFHLRTLAPVLFTNGEKGNGMPNM